MEWDVYYLVRKTSFIYEFYSEGQRGRIKKIIQFQRADHLGKNVFNLAFGDFNRATGSMEDGAVSNNGDQLKFLHTVAEAVVRFLREWPEAIILIQASTSSRIRLYQMRIAGFWSEISQQYEVQGELRKKWFPFQKGVNYERFLIYKKVK
jgi:hypothetical protein